MRKYGEEDKLLREVRSFAHPWAPQLGTSMAEKSEPLLKVYPLPHICAYFLPDQEKISDQTTRSECLETSHSDFIQFRVRTSEQK